MEIGPGSGLLVDLILKNLNLKKVYLIDLPEVIAYCFIYLSYINPEIDISLPNEPHMRQTSLISFYIPNQIDEIGEFNLMCNTASFEEMNKRVLHRVAFDPRNVYKNTDYGRRLYGIVPN